MYNLITLHKKNSSVGREVVKSGSLWSILQSKTFSRMMLKKYDTVILEKWFFPANDSERAIRAAMTTFGENPSEKEIGSNKRVSNGRWASRGTPYKAKPREPASAFGLLTSGHLGRIRLGRAEAPPCSARFRPKKEASRWSFSEKNERRTRGNEHEIEHCRELESGRLINARNTYLNKLIQR